MIGSTIGHYQIERELGRGGMGVVYLAKDLKLGRSVAVKAISTEFTEDDTSRKRLMREARTAASLDHPFICKVIEVVESEDQLYLVMEYLDGQTLAEWIEKEKPTYDEILRLGSAISEALGAAHEMGVIHRDIKPANIIITSSGHPKIMDFGLAKPIAVPSGEEHPREAPTKSLITREDTIMGTYGYLAPELL